MPLPLLKDEYLLNYVQSIFKSIAKPPNSHQLTLDEIPNEVNQEQAIFRTLGQILTHGLVHLYGNDKGIVDLNRMSEIHISHAKRCMSATGWTFILLDKDAKDLRAIPLGKPSTLLIPRQNASPVKVQFVPAKFS